jgi:predicted pyridoxine 5'-phosphate oxidase superfamily flavin-nucleotide-binding protein
VSHVTEQGSALPTAEAGAAAGAPLSGGDLIPDDARRLVGYVGLAYAATVNEDGSPNLSPKGSLKVLDERTLVFGDIASPGTMRNVRARPGIEVNVLDVFRRRGYRFRGRAEISYDPALIEFVAADLGEIYPIAAAVLIRVEQTRPLVSPIYWLMDAKEEDVVAKWEVMLGYHRRGEAVPGTDGAEGIGR